MSTLNEQEVTDLEAELRREVGLPRGLGEAGLWGVQGEIIYGVLKLSI